MDTSERKQVTLSAVEAQQLRNIIKKLDDLEIENGRLAAENALMKKQLILSRDNASLKVAGILTQVISWFDGDRSGNIVEKLQGSSITGKPAMITTAQLSPRSYETTSTMPSLNTNDLLSTSHRPIYANTFQSTSQQSTSDGSPGNEMRLDELQDISQHDRGALPSTPHHAGIGALPATPHHDRDISVDSGNQTIETMRSEPVQEEATSFGEVMMPMKTPIGLVTDRSMGFSTQGSNSNWQKYANSDSENPVCAELSDSDIDEKQQKMLVNAQAKRGMSVVGDPHKPHGYVWINERSSHSMMGKSRDTSQNTTFGTPDAHSTPIPSDQRREEGTTNATNRPPVMRLVADDSIIQTSESRSTGRNYEKSGAGGSISPKSRSTKPRSSRARPRKHSESRSRSPSPGPRSPRARKSRSRSPKPESSRAQKSSSRSPSPKPKSSRARESRSRSPSPRPKSTRTRKSKSRSPSPRPESSGARESRSRSPSPRPESSGTRKSGSRSPRPESSGTRKSRSRSPSPRPESSEARTSKSRSPSPRPESSGTRQSRSRSPSPRPESPTPTSRNQSPIPKPRSTSPKSRLASQSRSPSPVARSSSPVSRDEDKRRKSKKASKKRSKSRQRHSVSPHHDVSKSTSQKSSVPSIPFATPNTSTPPNASILNSPLTEAYVLAPLSSVSPEALMLPRAQELDGSFQQSSKATTSPRSPRRPISTTSENGPNQSQRGQFWNSMQSDKTGEAASFSPTTRLIGELAFQLDRRILNYVFNSVRHTGNKTRFYGYLVKNIPEMIRKRVQGDNGEIHDEALATLLNYRYTYVMYCLEPMGYNIKNHADFCIDLVNRYGLLPVRSDNAFITNMPPSEGEKLRDLLRQVTPVRELRDVLILLDCLVALAKDDGRNLFLW